MGIDFKALLGNLGVAAAKMQNDKTKIDTKAELNTYVSGWDAIKAQAEENNAKAANVSETVDIAELEAEMKSELAGLMGADFGVKAGQKADKKSGKVVFNEADDVLTEMMDILAQSPVEGTDLVDMNKLRKYNSKPVFGVYNAESQMNTLREFGFDSKLVDILMEQTPGAIEHISRAIKSGEAERISNEVTNRTEIADMIMEEIPLDEWEALFSQKDQPVKQQNRPSNPVVNKPVNNNSQPDNDRVGEIPDFDTSM